MEEEKAEIETAGPAKRPARPKEALNIQGGNKDKILLSSFPF